MSGHCVEGEDTATDWWHWEQRPGRIVDGSTSHAAASFLTHYDRDFALAAQLRHNAVFLALSWARIQPARDRLDRVALDRYASLIGSARAHGLEPVIALQHITLPQWLQTAGGWPAEESVSAFACYARAVIDALGTLCSRWVPVYEPGYALLRGVWENWPGGKRLQRARRHAARAEAAAAEVIRSRHPSAEIGTSIRLAAVLPAAMDSLCDHRAARRVTALLECPAPDYSPDFTALSYFGAFTVGFRASGPWGVFARPVDSPQEMPCPKGFSKALEYVRGLGRPIYICGNGVATGHDQDRVHFLLDHLWALRDLPGVRGYFHYALINGWEWNRGYASPCGLIHVDRKTQARTPNSSAFLLRDLIHAGNINPGLIQRHAPNWELPTLVRSSNAGETGT